MKTASGTTAYTDGSATFAIKDSKITWKDAKEDAGKGMTFDRK